MGQTKQKDKDVVKGSDVFTPTQRSALMARVRNTSTKPEKIVRSTLHRLGYRFRIQRRDLPGKPDIVLPKYKAVIMVHGCFWHQHPGCSKATFPKNNENFWREKLLGNMERDKRNKEILEEQGWKVITVWECETKKRDVPWVSRVEEELKAKS